MEIYLLDDTGTNIIRLGSKTKELKVVDPPKLLNMSSVGVKDAYLNMYSDYNLNFQLDDNSIPSGSKFIIE